VRSSPQGAPPEQKDAIVVARTSRFARSESQTGIAGDREGRSAERRRTAGGAVDFCLAVPRRNR
jgi:hypothetical protein